MPVPPIHLQAAERGADSPEIETCICMRHSRDDCRVCRQGAPALRVGFESLVTSICNFSLQAATTSRDRLLLSCCRSSQFHAELRWGSSLSKTSAGFLRTEAGEIEYAC